jgi:hypothetical protein
MTALVGGEVQGKVSAVVGLVLLDAKAKQAGGEDLADLGEPLSGGHQVGVEGIVHRSQRKLVIRRLPQPASIRSASAWRSGSKFQRFSLKRWYIGLYSYRQDVV